VAVKAGVGLAQLLFSGEGGQNAEAIGAALGMGATFGVLLPYSRRHELEADAVGVRLMREAGLDPAAAVRFWERMSSRGGGAQPPEVLSTHPADGTRLEALRKVVGGGTGSF
jgi:predicted Zn-dependent protease